MFVLNESHHNNLVGCIGARSNRCQIEAEEDLPDSGEAFRQSAIEDAQARFAHCNTWPGGLHHFVEIRKRYDSESDNIGEIDPSNAHKLN
jgi:hypothetical protein